ncbi:MAG: hypothetical protein Hals2KO_27000 [Halioglobus sp.]
MHGSHPPEMRSLQAPLGFFSPEAVGADEERPGMLRAATLGDPDDPDSLDYHQCELFDLSSAQSSASNLDTMGFDTIDLGPLPDMQALLERVRSAGEISVEDARSLRRGLTGRVFRLNGGKCLRLLSIAPEGLIMRKSGPNDLKPDPDVEMSEMNGHGAARAIHGDQDVRGTPLKQIMRGNAPWLFRHQTPNGSNRWSPLMLVNLWIPLDQVTRPLTLMDRSSLDGRRHQLRYALPTDAFLDRDADMVVNDIWTFLHHAGQRWYFHSELDARRAYVFDTLGTPHGAVILPGEDVVERYYIQLCEVAAAVQHGELQAATERARAAGRAVLEGSTPALQHAVTAMQALLREAADGFAPGTEDWLRRVDATCDRLIRKSIEMRVVALLLPDCWPFNRTVAASG